MKKHAFLCILGIAIAAGSSAGGPPAAAGQANPAAKTASSLPKIAIKDLPQKYQEFMTLVTYIITDKEKDVFLRLTNDRDRDVFIESFWKIRDPTPGTPENEFKIEHLKRFEYANKNLGRGAGRPGWMTDRGKIYIILGEPQSKEAFDSILGLRPCEVWYYYTDESKGLPMHFGLVFYQKGGAGEYRLYDPIVDGPKALMNATQGNNAVGSEDYEGLYDRLVEIAPTLADMAISLIPGEYGYGYQPSPHNTILLAQIIDSPRANIKPTYATHFMEYKGMVSTEYMTNFIESEASVAILFDPIVQTPFLHYSIKPNSASVDYFAPKDQYYCAFSASVTLRKSGAAQGTDDLVFQYTKDFPFYFPPNDVDKVRASGISIEDAFPVIEGRYKLSILLQNAVGKEFSVYEREIDVPAVGAGPRLVGPLFGGRVQTVPVNVLVPFKIADKKLYMDPRFTFGRGESINFVLAVEDPGQSLWQSGQVQVTIIGALGKPESRKVLTYALRDLPFGRSISIVRTIEGKDLLPDYYEAEAALLDGAGKPLAFGRTQFVVSASERFGHPISRVRGVPLDNPYLFLGMLAQQYARINATDKADAFYRRSIEWKPDFTKGVAEYADFLTKAGRFDQALETVERIKADSGLRFNYLSIRGKALLGKERYAEAETSLLEANKIYNSDTVVLNALGLCFYRERKIKDALETLNASLKLNADQPDVKKLVAEVEKAQK